MSLERLLLPAVGCKKLPSPFGHIKALYLYRKVLIPLRRRLYLLLTQDDLVVIQNFIDLLLLEGQDTNQSLHLGLVLDAFKVERGRLCAIFSEKK